MPFDWDRIGLGRQSSLGRTFHGEPVGIMTDFNAIRNAWARNPQAVPNVQRTERQQRGRPAEQERRTRQRPDQISGDGMEGQAVPAWQQIADYLGRNSYGRYANSAVDRGIYGGNGPFNSGGYGSVPNILAPNMSPSLGRLMMQSPWKQSGIVFNDRQQEV